MRSGRRKTKSLIAVMCSVTALSCHLLLDLEYPRPDSTAGALDAEAAPVDPCHHAYPPPARGDDDPHTATEYWFAVERFDIPLRADGGTKLGFDLDRACTCQEDLFGGAPTCRNPKAFGPYACDYAGGVDDSLARVAAQVAVGGEIDPAEVANRKIRSGTRTALIFVGGYNGKPNDSDVLVAVLSSNGLFSNLGCGEVPRPGIPVGDGGTEHEPTWDGCDHWSPIKGRVINKSPSRVATPSVNGYVVDHVLVAEIAEIGLDVLGTTAVAYSGIAVGRMTPEGNSFRIDGVIAGRMPFAQLVDVIGRAELETGGTRAPFCATPYWDSFTPLLCSARDVMESPSQDRQDRECNAASVAMGFHARPALVDDAEYDRRPHTVECDAAIVCD